MKVILARQRPNGLTTLCMRKHNGPQRVALNLEDRGWNLSHVCRALNLPFHNAICRCTLYGELYI